MQNVCTANTHTRKSCVFHQQALVSLTPYSPRTLRTYLPLCPPPSLSSAAQSKPLLFHSPTLTLRQTMRRSRSAAQVAHNKKCRMQKKTQWELKQKRMTCETQRAIAQKFAQQLFIFLQRVCVLRLYCLLIGNFILCKFMPRSARQTSVSTQTHTHTYNVASASAATVTATEAFCVYFFSMKCV